MMTLLSEIPPVSIWGGEPMRAFADDIFYAAIHADGDATRIDIVRLDLNDGITWDELQNIKRECGYGDADAIEFYPKDVDLFNTGNVRHLFVTPVEFRQIRRARG